MAVDLLLSRLEAVRQTGPGRWVAKCPVHADKRASLLVTPKDDGKVTVYCFGCGSKGMDIVAALGLTSDVLFPPKDIWRQQGGMRRPVAPVRALRKHLDVAGWQLVFVTACNWSVEWYVPVVETASKYKRYGPSLKPRPGMKDNPPAWAVAARDAGA